MVQNYLRTHFWAPKDGKDVRPLSLMLGLLAWECCGIAAVAFA